jgi:hypothetical protein
MPDINAGLEDARLMASITRCFKRAVKVVMNAMRHLPLDEEEGWDTDMRAPLAREKRRAWGAVGHRLGRGTRRQVGLRT